MPDADPPLKRLGDFELIREIGRGGMGVFYEARQVSLNRRVALKILPPGLGLTGQAVQRFEREAQAAAKLHHTNIVPVFAIGEEDGCHSTFAASRNAPLPKFGLNGKCSISLDPAGYLVDLCTDWHVCYHRPTR